MNKVTSLKNKVIIITGSNSGIGFYGLKKFAELQATVIMASRSEARAVEAIALIKKDVPEAQIKFIPLDLQSLSSVKEFVKKFLAEYNRLDILVNNAGIMFGPYTVTVDGFESQMATNHFGHFALTGLLLPILIKSEGRIVNISSIAHRRGVIDFSNINYQRPNSYKPWDAYSRSKLANLLFTHELDYRFKKANIPVKVLAAHPGVSRTNLLFKNTKTQPAYNFLKYIMPLQSAQAGALPLIEACLKQDIIGGEYFGPKGLFEFGGKPGLVRSTKQAKNRDIASRLFDLSEQLTGIQYPL
jgi:NAD(P)-dependent dehydrogenase (short-subunit alcohol dehydrogenase family)